jgi:hypothetical protein
MAGQPHRLRANRMPPLVSVAQLHPVGRDADDPEPAPTPRHLHPGTHPNAARRLDPLGRRGRPYPASGGVRGWTPRRVGLGVDQCARRLSPPFRAQIVVASELQPWDSTMQGRLPQHRTTSPAYFPVDRAEPLVGANTAAATGQDHEPCWGPTCSRCNNCLFASLDTTRRYLEATARAHTPSRPTRPDRTRPPRGSRLMPSP